MPSLLTDWLMGGGAQKLADTFFDISASIIAKVVGVVLYIVGAIGGLLLNLGSQFTQFMFSLNDGVLSNPIVNIGWKITRDIANLGFVLAMVIVAVMTILRIEKYGAKAILPRLIAAAILVNFSLTLAGFFLDFSNVLTNFFITHGSPVSQSESLFTSTGHFMDGLTNSFGTQRFLNVSTTTIANSGTNGLDSMGNFGAIALGNVSSLFFTAAFTLLAALTFLAMGLMLAARFVWIAILLILAPVAWLFWVMPSLSSEFGKWWHNFLKWAFFPPILAFFMYLTIVSQNGLSNLAGATVGNGTGGTFISSFTQTASNMLLVIALLVGGLITAQSMGMAGAGAALGIAKGAGNKVKGWASGAALGMGAGAAAGVGGLGVGLGRRALALGSARDPKGRSYLEQLSASTPGWLNKAPLIGTAIRGASNLSTKAKNSQKKDVEGEEKKAENMTAENAVQELNSSWSRGIAVSNAKLVALGTKAAKEGKWTKIDPRMQDQIIKAVRTTGTKDKLLGYIPHEAAQFKENTDELPKGEFEGKAIQEAVAKYVADASKLDPKILEKIAPYLRQQHLNQIGSLGTDDQQKAVKDTLEGRANRKDADGNVPKNGAGETALEELQAMRVDLDKQLKAIEDAKARGESKQAIQSLMTSRDTGRKTIETFLKGLGKEQRESVTLLDSMKKALSWQDKFSQEERTMPI